MRLLASNCLGLMTAAAMIVPSQAQVATDYRTQIDQSLGPYAVQVVRVPQGSWKGSGIYLGNGLVLTAAHVVGHRSWAAIRVEVAGQELPAKLIKRGNFADVDLALVSIDVQTLPASVRLRRTTVCNQFPRPGEPVIVAAPKNIARSHVVSPAALPRNIAPKFRTAISDVATTGNSGSGVFDAAKLCLLGIISAKIQGVQIAIRNGHMLRQPRDIAKYFVPAPVISAFIPPEYHF